MTAANATIQSDLRFEIDSLELRKNQHRQRIAWLADHLADDAADLIKRAKEGREVFETSWAQRAGEIDALTKDLHTIEAQLNQLNIILGRDAARA
tara:strand:- start:473 stop:757 length:285 start_codon:yes stop_codon:yes gene_type:complete